MTRQNVTDGPREVMTRKCPTCGGDGIVYSEASAAIDVERRLRALVAGSRSQAYRVELAAPIAAALVGPGARRLQELEAMTKRRFFLVGKPDMHADHFLVLAEGKLADLAPEAPVAEGAELLVELGEVDRHDASAAVGKVDGFDVCVADAASLVGKRVKVQIERVLDGVAYATLARTTKRAAEPLTAEAEAEKPTRKPPARKGATAEVEVVSEELVEPEEAAEGEEPEPSPEDGATPATPKKKTRRGSRGGRNRKKPAAQPAEGGAEDGAVEAEAEAEAEPEKKVTIHLPADDLGRPQEPDEEGAPETVEAASENGAAAAKKKTRRGSRGGKNRRKRTAAAASAATNGAEPQADVEPEAEPEPEAEVEERAAEHAEWDYVPMSEWGDELEG
jgi:ribonuclease G